jgi:hypothetical protein
MGGSPVTDARDKRAAYVETLRAQLSEDGAGPIEDRVALELMEQILPYTTGERRPPPALTARLFRFYTDTGDRELAERHRANLHRHVAEGDEFAAEVLSFLSDDPFWRLP